jgi:glutathione S-transferase|tara:strand:- start:1490 stop:2086 length:597 start_codon:yes stop_codon:yes gene_type:complete
MRARMILKLADIKCELREVRLNNKPEHMLEASPKGTVPVLILEDKIIDESIDIVNWALNITNVFEGNIKQDQINLTEELIDLFDDKFKYHLDRYKYSNRYEDVDVEHHQNECLNILKKLETIIDGTNWIFGDSISKLDILILPFIRQFRIADQEWFDSQQNIPGIQRVLMNFLDSNIFKSVMNKYEEWCEGSDKIYFP